MRSRHARSLVSAAASLLVLVGCAGGSTATDSPTESGASSGTAVAPPVEASATTSAAPSVAESVEPSEPTAEPSATGPEDSGAPASHEPTTGADECSGTEENRDFYVAVADAVDWTLYCPVLPTGWFVDTGEYRLAGGGRMEIAYRGPAGARLEVHQGAFCSAGTSCVPEGSDSGQAALGPIEGSLVATDAGGWALAVDSGDPISWLVVGTGLSEDAFSALTAGFVAVDD
jgi:hypothetical protein